MSTVFRTGTPDMRTQNLPPVDRIIDEGVSKHVSSQVPDFVRADHEGFVVFLEAYYEWLEQKQNAYAKTHTLYELSDLDRTLEEFTDYFSDKYIKNFPRELATDQNTGTKASPENLMKNIKDFYKSKGTEKSYKLLFRVLYDSDLEFYYPKDDMLRVSDGKWIQPVSIKVTRDNDDKVLRNFENRVVQQFSEGGAILARATVDAVDIYNTGPYEVAELFLKDIVGNFETDQVIQCLIDGTLYKERVWSQITSVTVINPGQGYKVGDEFKFRDPSRGERNQSEGEGGSARVVNVGLKGEILELELVDGGVGYRDIPDELTTNEEPSRDKRRAFAKKKEKGEFNPQRYIKSHKRANVSPNPSIRGANLKPYGRPNMTGGPDFGGGGGPWADIKPEKPSKGEGIELSYAFGSQATYYGYYRGNDGKLSSNKKIQDSYFYQDFSYVLKSAESVKKYKSVLKKLIHPAGHEIFGRITLTNTLDPITTHHSQLQGNEIPVIGHYTPYNFNTIQNLRKNSAGKDLYPHGFNPSSTGGATAAWHIYGLSGGRLELTRPKNASGNYKGFTTGSFVVGQEIHNGMTASGGTGTVASWYLHRASIAGGSAQSGILFLAGVTGYFAVGSTIGNAGINGELSTDESSQPILPGNGTVFVEAGLTAHFTNNFPLGTGGTDAVYGGSAAAQGYKYDCWGIYSHPNSRGWNKIPAGISFGAVGLRWFFNMPFGYHFHSDPDVSTWLNPSGATSNYPYYGVGTNGEYSLPDGISTGSPNMGMTSCCSTCS
tara:strand:- start:23303 stop:25621 length:2319 start_codon:yes stop_codon:yes gene_type:complete